MIKEEKEKILEYLDGEICGDTWADTYQLGMDDAYRNVISFIDDMPIEEHKETNLDHYFNELKELIDQNFTFAAALEVVYYKHTKKIFKGVNVLDWLVQSYEEPKKYKLTQFEYDLLKISEKNKCVYMPIIDGLQERGYFKDMKIHYPLDYILENCEVSE